MLRRWGLISVSIECLLLAAAGAGADDTHYRAVPIGAHAIGLGGAFTGVADDVSAAYFNPAGLALSGTIGITGGFSINAWERFELDRALDQPDQSTDATDKFGRTVPVFIGGAVKFGAKDQHGDARNALALSVVEPNFSNVGIFLKLPTQPVGLSDSYQIRQNDRGTWYGVSYARRQTTKHAFGATLYLSVRKLYHSEVGLTLEGGTPISGDPDTFEGTSSAVRVDDLSFKAFHFVLRFGWLHSINSKLQLGVTAQLPGIPLKQRVDVFAQEVINDNRDPTMPTTTSTYLDEKVGAKLPIPAELRAGLEYRPAEKVLLAFDAMLYSPVPAGNRIDSSAGSAAGGLFFDTDTQRLATGNVAIGGDFSISENVTIETGFFTDLSSAIKIPSDPTRYYNPRIHRFAGTLSVGLHVGGIALAVGSTFIYGRGDATGLVVNQNNELVDYTRTQATSRIIYLHLTGATKAVVDLGTKAGRGIQHKRLEKKEQD
ncbi:MAG: hypothetical protein WAU39_04905 [Polyangiales bacterium]